MKGPPAGRPRARGKVIVCGIAFWYPLAGVTYQFLHYLLGLRRLGYDVYYVEDSGRWIYDLDRDDFSPDAQPNVDRIAPVLEAHGFAGRWAFRGNYPGGRCYGLAPAELEQLYRDADAMLNVTGAQEIRDEHRRIRRRIYVESDPVASQIQVVAGHQFTLDLLAAHDLHFSFGENLGAPDCGVPVERFTWQPTRQPVALDLWQGAAAGPRAPFTTVATWDNRGKDIEYRGEVYYWSKRREFEKFLELPRRTGERITVAADLPPEARDMLEGHGWHCTSSSALSRRLDTYRDFILSSRGEFTVAKDQNIRLRSGWFSDRSACYLAAGRPVITQDTAFGNVLPTGRGLFAFRCLDDVAAAMDAIASDYEGHCRAAQEIAREYFCAERVLGDLMARAGV